MDTHQDTDEAEAVPTECEFHTTVKDLARQCSDLIDVRNRLDAAIPVLPDNAADRDRLWRNLEEVMASLATAMTQLAAQPSEGHADLDCKATVLITILRRYITETLVPGPEVLALSLSLAEDVHRLTPKVVNEL